MKKLLVKIFVLFFLVGLVNIFVGQFVYKDWVPFYWGNQGITDKRNYLKSHKDNFNLMFIGSSKTYHQIDGVLFDSIIGKDQGIHSFNFGIEGMLAPESLYLYEHLLKTDSLQFKYVLMELNWISNVDYKNLHTRRSYYWLNNNYYQFSLQSIFDSQIPLYLKIWGVLSRTINFMEKTYNFGFISEYSKYKTVVDDPTQISAEVLEKNKGFIPSDRPNYLFSKSELASIDNIKLTSEAAFAKHEKYLKSDCSKVYLKKINDLIHLSEKKGIHLIFFMPPQWKNFQYDELIPLFQQIGNTHKIELADYRKYHKIFKLENLYDADHVNKKGSIEFTKEMALQFKNTIRIDTSKIQIVNAENTSRKK